jgi:hypothetical protein
VPVPVPVCAAACGAARDHCEGENRVVWCGVAGWRESYGDEEKSTDKVERNKKKKGG